MITTIHTVVTGSTKIFISILHFSKTHLVKNPITVLKLIKFHSALQGVSELEMPLINVVCLAILNLALKSLQNICKWE